MFALNSQNKLFVHLVLLILDAFALSACLNHDLIVQRQFINNSGSASGQDAAGGAIYSIGTGTTTIVDSDFEGNQASNGGALGNLGSSLILVNSTVKGNHPTGRGGNPGNGGGISMDGRSAAFPELVAIGVPSSDTFC